MQGQFYAPSWETIDREVLYEELKQTRESFVLDGVEMTLDECTSWTRGDVRGVCMGYTAKWGDEAAAFTYVSADLPRELWVRPVLLKHEGIARPVETIRAEGSPWLERFLVEEYEAQFHLQGYRIAEPRAYAKILDDDQRSPFERIESFAILFDLEIAKGPLAEIGVLRELIASADEVAKSKRKLRKALAQIPRDFIAGTRLISRDIQEGVEQLSRYFR